MIENSQFESPKGAIIRLLRSQGCCQTAPSPNNSHHLQEMRHYREHLHEQTVQERNKLQQIPCALTLAEQMGELKQVINGLAKENKGRYDYLMKHQQQRVNVNVEINEAEEQREHERLQQEYANLLRTLEGTNETNRRLVERLTRW